MDLLDLSDLWVRGRGYRCNRSDKSNRSNKLWEEGGTSERARVWVWVWSEGVGAGCEGGV